jgi:hypothetical protein
MTGTFGGGGFISNTTTLVSGEAGPFVPELWSNEIIAAYKQNLVLAQLVTIMNHRGKKGDTINIPKPARGSANLKAAATLVTPNVTANNLVAVLINRHFEYSVLIEDFADVQALGSMRRFYTDDAGFALAARVDWDLHLLGRSVPTGTPAVGANITGTDYTAGSNPAVIGGDGITAWSPTASANAGNASTLTDAGIRRMIRSLDDNNVPLSNRAFIVPPVEKSNLLGIARFTETQFVGEAGGSNSIRNGLLGDLYGNPFYVSTQCPKVLDAGAANDQRAGLYLHKDSWVLIEQMGVRSQQQYLQEYLSTLFTSDMIYGRQVIRTEGFVPFIVPA